MLGSVDSQSCISFPNVEALLKIMFVASDQGKKIWFTWQFWNATIILWFIFWFWPLYHRGIFIKTLADASYDRHTLSAPQIIFNILGFLGTIATTIIFTIYAKRRLKILRSEEEPLLEWASPGVSHGPLWLQQRLWLGWSFIYEETSPVEVLTVRERWYSKVLKVKNI